MSRINKLSTIHEYILKLKDFKKSEYIDVFQKNGSLKTYSALDYYEQIQKVAKALISVGIERGDRVAILSNTRHEWSVCDLAIISLGAISVPLYPNSTTDDLIYIINHSECKLVFADNRTSLRQLLLVRDKCPSLNHIVVFDPPPQIEEGLWLSFNEFLSGTASTHSQRTLHFDATLKQGSADEVITIIYTSGTTGQPKGVVLTHKQIISETFEAFSALQISKNDHTLSFLPYSHVLGRIEQWGHLIFGYRMTFSSGIEKINVELPQIEPTVIVGVPRVFEKLFTILKSKIDTSIIDRKIFEWAFDIGKEVSIKSQKGDPIDMKLKSESILANQLLFHRLKSQIFGSRLKFCVCGGAHLNTEMAQYFHAFGILILEGYGLTESTGAICVNRPYDFEFGTVGKPLNQVTIKISTSGEILIKSPTVFKEYYKDSTSTQEVLKGDWLHTGDIGEVTKNGRLIIKDREKNLIKTANGKYIAPQKIESLFKQLPYISHIHVHGDQRNYIVALITLNKPEIFKVARENNISFKSLEDLKELPFIKEMIRNGVAQINLSLSSHESIKNFAVLSEDFSIESGEVTPSLKIKRRIIDQKYKALIDSLYE